MLLVDNMNKQVLATCSSVRHSTEKYSTNVQPPFAVEMRGIKKEINITQTVLTLRTSQSSHNLLHRWISIINCFTLCSSDCVIRYRFLSMHILYQQVCLSSIIFIILVFSPWHRRFILSEISLKNMAKCYLLFSIWQHVLKTPQKKNSENNYTVLLLDRFFIFKNSPIHIC